MAQGMGAFAQGLANGYITGTKMKQAQELHDLQVEKLRDEKAFKDELKQANQDLKPTEKFTVTSPDGTSQMFDSQDAALKVMEGGDGFQLSRAFMVGDQTFDGAEQAEYAARVANSDVGKMSRQAQVAMEYGQPQVAGQLAQAASQIRTARTNALTDMTLAYKQSGNIDGLLNMYDQQAGDGGKSQLVDQGGQFMIVREVNGRTVPLLAQPAGSVAEVFDLAAMGFGVNHSNIVDIWKFDKTHGLGVRQQNERERHNAVSEGLSAGNLAVSQGNLGLRTREHNAAMQDRNNPRPAVSTGYDADGQVTPLTTTQTRNADGSWNTDVRAGAALPGVLGRAPQADPWASLLNPPQAPQPSLTGNMTPEQLKQVGDYLASKRTRPTAPANAGGLAPTPAPTRAPNAGLQVPPEVEAGANPYGNLPYGR